MFLNQRNNRSRNNNKGSRNNPTGITVIDILENNGIVMALYPENVIISLLEQQLSLYQSCLVQDTTMQQIEIMETLLDVYYTKTSNYPIQRAITLVDLAKLIRIMEPNPLENEQNNNNNSNKSRNSNSSDIASDSESMILETDHNKKNDRSSSADSNGSDDDIDMIYPGQLQFDNLTVNLADIDGDNVETDNEVHAISINEIGNDNDGSVADGDRFFDEQLEYLRQKHPIPLLEEAVELLADIKNTGVDDSQLKAFEKLDDTLATAHLWLGICQRELYCCQRAMEMILNKEKTNDKNENINDSEESESEVEFRFVRKKRKSKKKNKKKNKTADNNNNLSKEFNNSSNNEDNNNGNKSGLANLFQAMSIWTDLVHLNCRKKCKHFKVNHHNNNNNNNTNENFKSKFSLSNSISTSSLNSSGSSNGSNDPKGSANIVTKRQCLKCHKNFIDLFNTIQHLQILVDFFELHNLIPFQIFVFDCMLRLLSTVSDVYLWAREYRLLTICWLAMGYYKLGNSKQAQIMFDELNNVLLPAHATHLQEHVLNHIFVIIGHFQALMNDNGWNKNVQIKLSSNDENDDQRKTARIIELTQKHGMSKLLSLLNIY